MTKFLLNQQGFSLVELLITIAIIGVLSVSILSLFTTAVERQRRMGSEIGIFYDAQSVMEQIIADKKQKGFRFIRVEKYDKDKLNFIEQVNIDSLSADLKKIVVVMKFPNGLDSLVTLIGNY